MVQFLKSDISVRFFAGFAIGSVLVLSGVTNLFSA